MGDINWDLLAGTLTPEEIEERKKLYGVYNQQNTNAILDQVPKRTTFGDYAKGINGFLQSTGMGTMAGNLFSGIGTAVGNKYDDTQTGTQKSVQSGVLGAIGMIPGYGQIIAAGLGAINAAGEMTGLSTSNVNKESAKRFDKGLGTSAAVQNALGYIPGASAIAGGIGSAFFGGGRSNNFSISDDAMSMENGYSGSIADLQAAEDLSEKKWFSRKAKNKANAALDTARQTNNILAQIGRTNTQRKQSDYYQDLQNQQINRYSGENYLGMHIGRSGMKLMSIEEAKRIVASRKLQNGGTIPGVNTNLLPEGKLHKELNHLDETNPDLEDVTKKGIPVVQSDDNQQVAEVEKEELILRLEVTQKLEELMKNGSEEAMVEAGKLLTSEIIENTQDNTGQITEEV